MGEKKVENQYGVQVGDIFSENRLNCNYSLFYQIVALHGESFVVIIGMIMWECWTGSRC